MTKAQKLAKRVPRSRKPRAKKDPAEAAQKLAAEAAQQAEQEAQAAREYRLRMSATTAAAEQKRAKAQLAIALAEARDAMVSRDIALQVSELSCVERTIAPRERASGVQEATAVLLLSDIHPDETVDPATVNGLNEFGPEIAQERIERLIVGTRWMLDALRAHHGRAGFKIRDFVLGLLGDLISNTIHPELAEGNSMMPADAVVWVGEQISRVIDALLADTEIARIVVPCCHGNHDRMTEKIRHQTKAGNSLAWILYHHLAAQYRNEPRVEFSIARGNMVYTSVYDHVARWTHGDDIRYWGGVGGVTIPARKAIDSWNQSRHAHLTSMGHFHQITDHRDFVINGSVIGYSAYAQAIKARFEPAAQALFLLDKKRGKRMFSPIFLQDGRW